jgi:hypothetical protein
MPATFVLGLLFVAAGIGAVVDGRSAQPLAIGAFLVIGTPYQWVRVRAEIARRENETDLLTRSQKAARFRQKRRR